MRLEIFEDPPLPDSWLRNCDPRAKLIATFAFLLIVALTSFRHWSLFVVEAMAIALACALARVPWPYMRRRLLAALPFLVVLAFGAPASRGLMGGWGLMIDALAKALLSVSALAVLTATTSLTELLGGLRRLGAPSLIVASIALVTRYLFVLADEAQTMLRARQARTFEPPSWRDWLTLPNLVGALFIRSLERGERVHQAMLARGWDGEFRSLKMQQS